MGVRNLLYFVFNREDSLLEPYKLCKTRVIIDGSNFVCLFFKKCVQSGGHGEHISGGDYDYYYSRVIDFFYSMKRCGVDPIFLFDGCQPETKFQTRMSRREGSLESLSGLGTGSKLEIVPTLAFQAFFEGVDATGIECRQLYEEADPEIAALAAHLNCPVLSNDSDFFIYDVDFIPLRSMVYKCREGRDGSWYFPCSLYRSGNLSRMYPGLDRAMLPLVSVIYSNDFVGKDFTPLFTEDGNLDDVFRRLQASGSRESVITEILQSLDGEEAEVVERKIREVLTSYEVPSRVSLPASGVETPATRGAARSVYGLDLSGLPDKFFEFYESGKLAVFTLNLLRYQRYDLPMSAEDINDDSPHFSSVPIIREIYGILRGFVGAPEEFVLNIREGRKLRDRKILAGQDRGRIALGEGEDFGSRVFFQSLGLDGERLREFDDDWILFVTSAANWLRNTGKLGESHLSAVLLTALCLYVESAGGGAGEDRPATGNPTRSFARLVGRVPGYECATIRDRVGNRGGDPFPAIHAFACLQSVLFHVIQLNYLLGEVFRGFRISRFYSGTFLFRVFVALSEEGGFARVVKDLPRIRGAYEVLEKTVKSLSVTSERNSD